MEAAGLAETHGSPQHRRPGQVHLARLQDNGLIERLVFPAVTLPQEDSEQHGVVWKMHIKFLSRR